MKGRVRIINESRYEDAEVERLVRYGCGELEIPRKGLLVHVTNSRAAFSGIAWYRRDRRMTKTEHYFVTLRIGPTVHFPIKPFKRNGVEYDYKTWQEALVGIAAHEAKHVQDFFLGRGYESTWIEARTGPRARRGSGFHRKIGDQRVEPRAAAHEAYMLRKFRKEVAA